MPIKSIQKEIMERGVLGNMPRIGKLHKGAEKETGLKDLTYFRPAWEPFYKDKVESAFIDLYGLEPVEFHNVLLAADNADSAFRYFYEAWAHARLLRQCDGETIVRHWDEGDFRSSTTPMNCTCDPLNRDCNYSGTLEIVLPDLCEITGVWGKIAIETHSQYDIRSLARSMMVAEAFLSQLPNVAFWSVPFVVGRAPQAVPVTMTDKQGKKTRSNKVMSLLHADIEPDYKRVIVAPQLAAPAQRLLAGVNPATGEMPDTVIEQEAAWDRDYVCAETLHFFDHENHQANAIEQMIASGELHDGMNDDEAIMAIIQNREQRKAEKAAQNASKSHKKGSNSSADDSDAQSNEPWLKNAANAKQLIATASKKLDMTPGEVMQALQGVSDAPRLIENIQDFPYSKDEAWAACVAFHVRYTHSILDNYITDQDSPLYFLVKSMIAKKQASEIPF